MNTSAPLQTKAILLYNDECGVCRRIAAWVEKSATSKSGDTSLIVKPIGDDPKALKALNPDLDIWDAYATIHTLMPDGSMKIGGESVAEVFRRLPNTKWFAWSFSVSLFGFRPFQMILDLGYTVLADVRPLFGCESCGMPKVWARPFVRAMSWIIGKARKSQPAAPRSSPMGGSHGQVVPLTQSFADRGSQVPMLPSRKSQL
jgi:predicted DCC family thiol-disulfide oxidoreductase YuxK